MAKANLKRITESNRATLQLLSKVLIAANVLHILPILIFPSQRVISRYSVYYLISTILGYISYTFLYTSGSSKSSNGNGTRIPDDLSTGIFQYLVDYCYISVFVWTCTGLISRSFWMVYLIIPIYALYKAFLLARRLFFSP